MNSRRDEQIFFASSSASATDVACNLHSTSFSGDLTYNSFSKSYSTSPGSLLHSDSAAIRIPWPFTYPTKSQRNCGPSSPGKHATPCGRKNCVSNLKFRPDHPFRSFVFSILPCRCLTNFSASFFTSGAELGKSSMAASYSSGLSLACYLNTIALERGNSENKCKGNRGSFDCGWRKERANLCSG